MRAVIAATAAAAVLLGLGGAAAAHANYVRSNPAADAQLKRPPTEVRVTVSESPDARGSDIAVLDAAGRRVDLGDVTVVSNEANTLRVSLGEIADGGYIVAWTALSTVDGHQTKGAFAFSVNAPLPAIGDIGPTAPPPSALEIAGRALSFAGMALLTGLAFFTLFIRVPEEAAELQRERRLALLGGGALVAGSAMLILALGAGIPGRLLALLGLRGLAGASALALVAVPSKALSAEARREAFAFLGLAAGLTATLVSHAAAADLGDVAIDYLHVIAISIWLGGVVAFSYVAMPAARSSDARELGGTIWRFSLTALVAVTVIVTTGVLSAFDRLVLLEDLIETPYGVALLAKIVLLAGLLALGALNLLVWGPRLRRGLQAGAQFWRSVVGESALFAGVLLAAAFLTALVPPAQASGAAFDETRHVSGIRVQLLVASELPGRNRFVVRVQQGLRPVTAAEKVVLRFTMIEHDMGEQELVAAERAAGEYVAEGSPTSMIGTWNIEVIVRLSGRQDMRALFSVPVSQPEGQAATTKVIPIPPHQLIVFAEPVLPQAGAPLTINVVVVDQKGDPVAGRKVRATFDGPATQAPLDGVENAAELGPGRYRFSLAGLDAGTWRITLSVDGAGSGVYELDVSR
ncbi:MAG TPA: copper resistance protein CopC [Candidatus Limnocylindria bacterium]|nr:copper resistance protein CopC [Candidatus Limnocylindria bacterium]